jgi:hypothetical protein
VVTRWLARLLATALLAWIAFVACEPSLDLTTYEVSSPRVLAIRSEAVADGGVPTDYAEVIPGNPVNLTALYVSSEGPLDTGPFDWAFCLARNPLSNLEPFNPSCADRSGPATVFQELNLARPRASSLTAPTPSEGCANFGPNPPPNLIVDGGPEGGITGRPVDPDSTGGFYQPIRLVAGDPPSAGQIAVDFVRINCGPPSGVPPGQTGVFSGAATAANTNPAIDSVVDMAKGPGALPEAPQMIPVAPGQELDLRASWATCSPEDVKLDAGAAGACTGSQRYAILNPATAAVTYVWEQMRVSWFSTGGTFANDTTAPDAAGGVAAGAGASHAENAWTAPTRAARPIYVWVVLRDDRGGVGWASYVFDVKTR